MKFLVSYYHGGSWYATHIFADTKEDAQEICKAHSLRYDGELIATIEAPQSSAWIFNLFIRFRNWLTQN